MGSQCQAERIDRAEGERGLLLSTPIFWKRRSRRQSSDRMADGYQETEDYRRRHLMRQRAELLTHGQQTTSQYYLPEIGKKIA